MSWQLLIIIQSILGAFSVVITRMLARDGNKYQYAVVLVGFLFEWVLACLLVFGLGKFTMPDIELSTLGLLLLGGLGFGISNFLFFDLLGRVPASVASVQMTLNRLMAILLALLLLGESLNGFQFLGTILMLSAVLIVSYKRGEKKSHHLHITKALLVLLIMSGAYALGTVAEKSLLDEMGIYSYAVVGWTFQTIVVAIMVFARRKKWKYPPKNKRKLLYVYSLLFAISGLFFIATLVASDSSSKTVSAGGIKVVLSVLFGYVLLKERKDFKRVFIAAVISVVGLSLLFM